MDDIGLDAAPPQPARQPKAVASGLIGDDDALDLPTRLGRFVAPTLHKLQQLVLVGRKLLQWLALDTWDQPRDETVLHGSAGGRSEPPLAYVQAMRTDFGRPSSSMRFRTATATFISVA